MTGLTHDLPLFDMVLGGGSGKAVAQAVGPVVIGIHAHQFGVVLDDEGNGLIGDARLADVWPLVSPRKTGPVVMPLISSQFFKAVTAQRLVSFTMGMAII